MKKYLFFLSMSLLLLVGTVHGQSADTGEEAAQLAAERQYLSNYIVPAISDIIHSLEVQNAPVPGELRSLEAQGKELSSREAIDAFKQDAEVYFGLDWQDQLIRDASNLSAEETMLLVRARIYLSSLSLNAERIALESPLSAEQIRETAAMLLGELAQVEEEDEHKEFFQLLYEKYEEIFPPAETKDIAVFRQDVTKLLADTADAITILVERDSEQRRLNADLADLQSRLLLVDDSQKLPAWLARFDTFSSRLLSHATSTDLPVLINDIRALLNNLSTYLASLQKMNIDTGTLPERTAELRDDLSTVQSEKDLDAILTRLETLLTTVNETYSDTPEE